MQLAEQTGILLVITAATLWATVGVATQLVPGALELSPELYGFARTAIAGPVLLMMAWIVGRGRRLPIARIWRKELAVFALASVLFQLSLFRSFAGVGVTVTVFLTVCLPPVLAVIWTLAVRQVPVNAAACTALGLALAGLASFAIGRGAGVSVVRMDAVALFYPMLASVAFVVMSYAARSLAGTATPLAVAGAGLTLSGLMLLPALPWILPPGDALATTWALADGKVLILLLYLGLGPTALAYFCYCAGMARCKSAISGLIATMIEPVVAAALAMALLHERLTSGELVGCILLMLAMVVLWHGDRPKVTMPLGEPAE